IVGRVGIHLPGRDRVETLGRLAIALLNLGAELTRPAADRIGLQQRVAAGLVLLPDLELGLFLEDARKDRRLLAHALLLDERPHLRRHRRQGLGNSDAVGLAAGERDRSRDGRRSRQRPPKGQCSIQPGTPPPLPEKGFSPSRQWTTVILKMWLRQGNSRHPDQIDHTYSERTVNAGQSVRPIFKNFSRLFLRTASRSILPSWRKASAMASPVAAMAAAGSLWAPPEGSPMMPSMMPNLTRSWAVIFMLVAASSALVVSRHRIEAAPSGEMTL